MRYIRKKMSDSKLSPVNKSIILITCLGLLFGLILKLFVIEFLHVSGTSMENAIQDRSTVAVNKLAYGLVKPFSDSLLIQWKKPAVNDIVIYLYNDKIVVKRCIACEGQSLEYSENPVYTLKTGDKEIPLTENQYLRFKDIPQVPEGYILAVGDNYGVSVDSRDYGFVSVKNVLGRVLCK